VVNLVQFSTEKFLSQLRDLMQADHKENSVAFWDLETHFDSGESELAVATAVSYLASAPNSELEVDLSPVLNQLNDLNSPLVSVLLDLAVVCNHNIDTRRSQFEMALFALKQTMQSKRCDHLLNATSLLDTALAGRYASVRLLNFFLKYGWTNAAEDLVSQNTSLSQAQRNIAMYRVSALKNANSFGMNAEFQEELSQVSSLHTAIRFCDYKTFQIVKKDDVEASLLRWLIYKLSFAENSAAGKSIVLPSTIRRSREINNHHLALLSACESLEKYDKSRNSSGIFNDKFADVIAKIPEFENELLVLCTAASIAEKMNETRIQQWMTEKYHVRCQAISNGSTEDLFDRSQHMQNEFGVDQLSVSQFARGSSFAKSSIKIALKYSSLKLARMFSGRATNHWTNQAIVAEVLRDLVNNLAELKGGAQKFAQLGMSVESILPYDLKQEIREKLSHQTPMNFESIKSQIEASTGRPLEETFASFDTMPIAMGSIGQVHHATLRNKERSEVAVKVTYPKISDVVAADFRNLRLMANLLKRFIHLKNMKAIFDRWENLAVNSCDLALETDRGIKCRPILLESGCVAPVIYTELCSDRMHVSEFIHGQSFSDFAANATQSERNDIGIHLWRSLYDLMNKGFFRADVHPENYLVRDGKLVYLDFGGTLAGNDFEGFNHFAFMHAFADNDAEAVEKLFVEHGWCSPEDAATAAQQTVGLLAPPFQGTFRFTQDYVRDVFRGMNMKLTKQVQVPIDHIELTRVFWSLYSMLAELRAEADWSAVLKLGKKHSAQKQAS